MKRPDTLKLHLSAVQTLATSNSLEERAALVRCLDIIPLPIVFTIYENWIADKNLSPEELEIHSNNLRRIAWEKERQSNVS